MNRFLDYIFVKDHLFLNILAAVSFGYLFGYYARLEADSEGIYGPDLYFQFAVVCAAGMLIATLFSHIFQNYFRIIPSFLLIGFIGPLLMCFAYRMLMLFWEPSLSGTEEQIRSDFGNAVVMGFFMYIPFALYLVFTRTIAYSIRSFYPRRLTRISDYNAIVNR